MFVEAHSSRKGVIFLRRNGEGIKSSFLGSIENLQMWLAKKVFIWFCFMTCVFSLYMCVDLQSPWCVNTVCHVC